MGTSFSGPLPSSGELLGGSTDERLSLPVSLGNHWPGILTTEIRTYVEAKRDVKEVVKRAT